MRGLKEKRGFCPQKTQQLVYIKRTDYDPMEILISGAKMLKKHCNSPKFGVMPGPHRVGGDWGDFGELNVPLFWGEKRELQGRGSPPALTTPCGSCSLSVTRAGPK